MTFFGPYLVACALLVVAGVGKGLRPLDTARAFATLMPRVPASLLRQGIRTLAVVEAGLGVAAALMPRPPLAAAVALSYLVFAAFIVFVRLRHGALASCGCFSTPDTPATWLHVGGNLVLAAAAAAVAAARSSGTVFSFLARQPLEGVPLVAACAAGTWLTLLTLVALARLSGARRLATVSDQSAGARR